jgi:hypothetical protein
MPDGWTLIGPLIAVAMVGLLGAAFWRIGLKWVEGSGDAEGLAIFGEPDDDFGLLCPAAVTDDAEVADDIRQVLIEAGIRATLAVDRDDRVAVLVFADQAEAARRLVGDSPFL